MPLGEVVLHILKSLGKIILAGILACFLLTVVAFFYGYTGVHIPNPTGATDYTWEPGQWRSNMSEGFAWMRMDADGFNNTEENEEAAADHVDILVMGGSHTEGINVPQDKNYSALLSKALPDWNVYNIGMSGHFLPTCVSNLPDALDTYHPTKCVILETGDIELNAKDMQQVVEGTYPDIPSYSSGTLGNLQRYMPLIKTQYKNLSDWRAKSANQERKNPSSKPADIEESTEYAKTVESFLAVAAESANEHGVHLILCYHPTVQVQSDGSIRDTTDSECLQVFETTCRENDITYVNPFGKIEEMYYSQHVLPQGFANTSPGSGHINVYGHAMTAEALVTAIQEAE